jgi:hypothetical protein
MRILDFGGDGDAILADKLGHFNGGDDSLRDCAYLPKWTEKLLKNIDKKICKIGMKIDKNSLVNNFLFKYTVNIFFVFKFF